jgi:hypothetical protein
VQSSPSRNTPLNIDSGGIPANAAIATPVTLVKAPLSQPPRYEDCIPMVTRLSSCIEDDCKVEGARFLVFFIPFLESLMEAL